MESCQYIYIYIYAKTFIISNNLWKIIENLSVDQIKINKEGFKQTLYFGGVIDECSTYIDNIITLPSATIFKYSCSTGEYSFKKYFKIKFTPDSSITLPIAVEQADQGLHSYFELLYKKFLNKKFGFGNSGGLDSRLIGIYAKEHDFNITSFYIGTPKPNGLLYSTEYLNSTFLPKYCNFEHTYANISCDNAEFVERLLLDIRNCLACFK